MDLLERHKHEGLQLKESQKYTFIFIGIGMTFICASALVLLAKGTDMKDLYAAFSGIIGGLIGGLITLEGVRRTVYSQMDIESLKLMPNKLVHLHKLKKEMKALKDIRDSLSMWKSSIGNANPLTYEDKSKEMGHLLLSALESFKEIKKFTLQPLDEEEYRFIEIVSEIDLDIYYKMRQLFEELTSDFKNLNNTIQSINLSVQMEYERHPSSVMDLFNKYNSGSLGENGFITLINSTNTTCGHVLKDIRKSLPYLETMHNSIDKRIEELNIMIDAKFKEFKELDKKIL